MKLQAIRRVCLTAKRWRIVNARDGSQWISDWRNYYRIIGIRIEEDYLEDVFAVPDKKMSNCLTETVSRAESFFTDAVQEVGEPVYFVGGVWALSELMYAFEASGELCYVPESAIKPTCFDDRSDLRLVYDGGQRPLIAIYRGFFIDALVAPIQAEMSEKISEALRELGSKPVLGAGREVIENVDNAM